MAPWYCSNYTVVQFYVKRQLASVHCDDASSNSIIKFVCRDSDQAARKMTIACSMPCQGIDYRAALVADTYATQAVIVLCTISGRLVCSVAAY